MTTGYTEDSLVEQPAIALCSEIAWETANCLYETFGPKVTIGRDTPYDVVWSPGCGWLSGIPSGFALTYELSNNSPSPVSSLRGRGSASHHLSLKTETHKAFVCFVGFGQVGKWAPWGLL